MLFFKYSCTCTPFISPALRIHMSNTTSTMLQEMGVFEMECRGEIQVKVSYIHYNDVIMSAIASRNCLLSRFQAQIKENIKAPRHWPLWGNSPVTGEFPAQRASNAEMFSFDDIIMSYTVRRLIFPFVMSNEDIWYLTKIQLNIILWGRNDAFVHKFMCQTPGIYIPKALLLCNKTNNCNHCRWSHNSEEYWTRVWAHQVCNC